MSGKKLYIGSLSWNTTQDGLQNAFGQFGEITEVKIITDKMSGRSKGFGFVTFADEAGAESAKNGMDGKDLDGRTLRVDFAQDRPQEERRPRSGGGFGGNRGGFGGDRGDRGDRGGFGGGRSRY